MGSSIVILFLRSADHVGDGLSSATIGAAIDREIGANQPGAGLVAARFADYLFVLAVRDHLLTGAAAAADGCAGCATRRSAPRSR